MKLTYGKYAGAMAEFEVTNSNNGGHVNVSSKDVIVVRLSENPTTGYRWDVDSAGTLRLIDDSFDVGSGAPGAGGKRALRFAAVTPGRTTLALALRRPWETETGAASRFQLTVDVK